MKAIDGIDWKLLREQKITLLNVIGEITHTGQPERVEHLDGIINLIDSIQDEAVETGKVSEAEVFGPDCPVCGSYMRPVMVDTDGTNLEEGYECPECKE